MTMKSWVCSIASTAAAKSLNSEDSLSETSAPWCDAVVRGQFEIEPGVLGPGVAVLEIMGEAFLPRVEVDRGDALPDLQQRERDMHRDRGFARPTLFVAEDNTKG